MTFHRYAVYFLPDDDWAAFGAAWLGWDAVAGREVWPPSLPGIDLPRITRRPRRYGFHATIVPPFRLADGQTPEDLVTRLATFCAGQPPRVLAPVILSRIGRFMALTAPDQDTALRALAGAAVSAMDGCRAPPTPAEQARRRTGRLTDRQEALLTRWGYPYVMEEFRFHLTLTGPLRDEADAVESALRRALGPRLDRAMPLSALSLMGEGEDGFFRQIARVPLTGSLQV